MPLIKGKSQKTVSKNIAELHTGKTYSKTRRKYGKKAANLQAVAIALNQAGLSKPVKKGRKRGSTKPA
jgi:hypothetical protein